LTLPPGFAGRAQFRVNSAPRCSGHAGGMTDPELSPRSGRGDFGALFFFPLPFGERDTWPKARRVRKRRGNEKAARKKDAGSRPFDATRAYRGGGGAVAASQGPAARGF